MCLDSTIPQGTNDNVQTQEHHEQLLNPHCPGNKILSKHNPDKDSSKQIKVHIKNIMTQHP